MTEPTISPDSVDAGDLAISLGITVAHLRSLRKDHLIVHEDWFRQGSTVRIRQSGVEKLRSVIGLGSENPPPAAQESMRAIVKAFVVSIPKSFQGGRRHFPNPMWIRCRPADSVEIVWVRVRHSANYFPMLRNGDPMIVEIEKQPDGRWAAVGRAPRFPGRW